MAAAPEPSERSEAQEPVAVVLRVLKAELYRSFSSFLPMRRMVPYAVVEWQGADGSVREVARTRTDPSGQLNPQWDFTSREQPYKGEHRGDKVEFRVMNERFAGVAFPCFCGSASVLVDDLLLGTLAPTGSQRLSTAPMVSLPLVKKGEETGSITVQAVLVRATGDVAAGRVVPAPRKQSSNRLTTTELSFTCVDPSMFEMPVTRIGVSGGTAPFFRLRLRPEAAEGRSLEHFVGKDLSHARDEVLFYEKIRQLARDPESCSISHLLPFMFEYAGVLTVQVADAAPEDKPKQLLVMRNLRDGCQALRMVDIKMGQRTADAGWQGKSRVAALRQGVFDGVTNSSEEGFRLEGFDGPPPALASMDPLLDLAGLSVTKDAKVTRKKAMRIMLQRMPAVEMLTHLLDVHQVPPDPGDEKLATTLTPTELAELVHYEMVVKLTELAFACRLTLLPQKWVGSSVALGFDAGHLPLRGQEQAVRSSVKVNIFDWGRSELNTLQGHMDLSDAEHGDRARFWCYYTGGIDRLQWETMRAYWHRYGATSRDEWQTLRLAVLDFDSLSDNDFIGQVTLPLVPTSETTVFLLDGKGSRIKTQQHFASVTFAIDYRDLPPGGRLAGAWRIRVIRAQHLPPCDLMQGRPAADPFVVLTAIARDGRLSFRQQTSVVIGCLDPQWEETLEVPVASRQYLLEEALSEVAAAMGGSSARELMGDPLSTVLPSQEVALRAQVDEALAAWRARLDRAGTSACGSARFCTPLTRVPSMRRPRSGTSNW